MPGPLRRAHPFLSLLVSLVALSPPAAAQVAEPIVFPETHFGFRMGADRQLAAADAIERYFELIATASDRVEIVNLGATTEGNRTIAAIVSAPENIKNLPQIRIANQRLA